MLEGAEANDRRLARPAVRRRGGETCDTLHMWTQIVGKVRLALTPHLNHWWQVPLYVGARGLTTTAIPYRDSSFEIEFDFVDHVLVIRTSRRRRAGR